MESLRAGDLQIDVDVQDASVLLHWNGASNERQPEKLLRPFFKNVLDEASAAQKSVELHFEKIDRFNSSTILCIIQLIQEARHRQIRIAAIYDGTRKWQRLTFDALRIFVKPDGLFMLRPAGELTS